MHRSEFIGVKKWPRICRLELFFVPRPGVGVAFVGQVWPNNRPKTREQGTTRLFVLQSAQPVHSMPEGPSSPTRKATSRRCSLAWGPPNGVPIDFGGFYLGGPPCSENCMMLLLHSEEKTEMHKRKRNAAKSTQAPTAQRSACLMASWRNTTRSVQVLSRFEASA